MHKRILCMLLTALILLSLIPAMALPSRAVSDMKTGEKCIAILKEMEGFIKFPTFDHGQYSVGYGSRCDKDDYPDGITEEEADQLLREYLADMEKSLNDFANRHGILFSQNQFDALMLFTYNCGPNWLYGDGEFRQAVLDNAGGNTFIYYITQWTAASAELHMGLVNRRLIEADMYLNGSYTNVKPSNYTYVLYENNEGVGQVRVQGYDCNLTAHVKPTPTRDGYKFLGWYTAAKNGSWVTELTVSNAEQTLYAHWQAASATPATAPSAAYSVATADLVSRKTYDAPNGKEKDILRADGVNLIRAEYVDASGVKWGKLANNSWVKLGDPLKGAWEEVEEDGGVKVTVTGDYVNVRTGPGTEYKVVSAVQEKDEIVLTQVCDVNGVLWGRFRGGWICLQYTDYSGGLTPTPKPEQTPEQDPSQGSGNNQAPEPFIATGTVTATQLNIRATAGTHGYVMGVYKRGDKVSITEKAIVGNVPWGKTDKGWICLTYVDLDSPGETPETTVPETTVPETTVPETTTPPGPGEQKPEVSTDKGIPATVISKAGLNIRAGAGTNFPITGAYKANEKICILEQKTVGGITWGRTDKGWVSMQYVKLDEVWTSTSGIYGTVISASGLNIRSGAGVGYAPVGNYRCGKRIVILEQTVVGGQTWGRTDLGWVCMTYVRLEQNVPGSGNQQPTPETTVPESTKPGATEPEPTEPEATEPESKPSGVTGVITAGGLNIRATPGTNGAIVGGYRAGDKVTILEQTVVNGASWGRTDKGWISMAYVKLDTPAVPEDKIEVGDTGVVTASELCIRKGPGTGNAIVGAYKRGQTVTILEITKVGTTSWGRTDKGWICLTHVKMDTPAAPESEMKAGSTGVITASELCIRKGPGAGNAVVGVYKRGQTVTILEITKVGATSWGRTDKGWICLDYVQAVAAPEQKPNETTPETTVPETTVPETTVPETTEPAAAFNFTYEEYVSALNSELAAYDIVAKAVNSNVENSVCYEFVAISDNGSYGVMLYIELAENSKKAAGVMLVCDAADEIACENLSVFATYSMLYADNTITEADLQDMMSEALTDADGNICYVMERESGEYAFVVGEDVLYFFMNPVSE